MTDEPKKEPLEGFHVTEYDDTTEEVKISVHKYLLKHPRQRDALAKKFVEIISSGPSVRTVTAVARDEPEEESEPEKSK
jgi:hypothetical protein